MKLQSWKLFFQSYLSNYKLIYSLPLLLWLIFRESILFSRLLDRERPLIPFDLAGLERWYSWKIILIKNLIRKFYLHSKSTFRANSWMVGLMQHWRINFINRIRFPQIRPCMPFVRILRLRSSFFCRPSTGIKSCWALDLPGFFRFSRILAFWTWVRRRSRSKGIPTIRRRFSRTEKHVVDHLI